MLSPHKVHDTLIWSFIELLVLSNWYFSDLTMDSIPGMCTGKRRLHSWLKITVRRWRFVPLSTYYDDVVDLFDDVVYLLLEEPLKFGILEETIKYSSWQIRKSRWERYQSDDFIVNNGSHSWGRQVGNGGWMNTQCREADEGREGSGRSGCLALCTRHCCSCCCWGQPKCLVVVSCGYRGEVERTLRQADSHSWSVCLPITAISRRPAAHQCGQITVSHLRTGHQQQYCRCHCHHQTHRQTHSGPFHWGLCGCTWECAGGQCTPAEDSALLSADWSFSGGCGQAVSTLVTANPVQWCICISAGYSVSQR